MQKTSIEQSFTNLQIYKNVKLGFILDFVGSMKQQLKILKNLFLNWAFGECFEIKFIFLQICKFIKIKILFFIKILIYKNIFL
jgi:hypothetical protein